MTLLRKEILGEPISNFHNCGRKRKLWMIATKITCPNCSNEPYRSTPFELTLNSDSCWRVCCVCWSLVQQTWWREKLIAMERPCKPQKRVGEIRDIFWLKLVPTLPNWDWIFVLANSNKTEQISHQFSQHPRHLCHDPKRKISKNPHLHSGLATSSFRCGGVKLPRGFGT